MTDDLAGEAMTMVASFGGAHQWIMPQEQLDYSSPFNLTTTPRMLITLGAWPLLTAMPAFIVALAVAALLARLPTKRLAE
jgi:hypothetical protein